MKVKRFLTRILHVALLLVLAGGLGQSQAQRLGPQVLSPQDAIGTVFTYQGQIKKDGNPVNSNCGLQFSLWDAAGSGSPPSGGTQISTTQTITNVSVTNGLFTIPDLDFGNGAFNGEGRWLQIAVNCVGDTGYTDLAPRQALTPAPYAMALPGLWTQQAGTSPNLIGGYSGNSVTAGVTGATIGGGGGPSTYINQVTDNYGTVSGGVGNRAGDDFGTVLDARYAVVGGGYNNVASGEYASVGGGYNNVASGEHASVGGGYHNIASGNYAIVPGGQSNVAGGTFSFAAGRGAQANAQGCFVWADSYGFGSVTCNEVNNRWAARASGGVYFYTNTSLNAGSYLAVDGSAWNAVSSRSRKENLAPVDARKLLTKLAAIEIGTWNYKVQAPSIRHVGPMADDFNALLPGLGGEGEEYINSLDADGIALAAIQGLYELSQEQSAHIEALETENTAQQKQIDGLEARLAALEQGLQANDPVALSFHTGWSGWFVLSGLATLGVVFTRRRGGRGEL